MITFPNPYAPPVDPVANEAPPPAPMALRPPSDALKWGYFTVSAVGMAVQIVLLFASVALDLSEATAPEYGPALGLVVSALGAASSATLVASLIISLMWLHGCWQMVPLSMRKAVSPRACIAYFFIPCFNAYWIFASQLRLCTAMDAMLAYVGSRRRAPRGLAIAACTLHFIPWLNRLVAPVLWFLYMHQMDAARVEIAEASQRGQGA